MRILEEHVVHPGASLRFLRIEAAAFRGQRHRHPEIELTWIEQGVGLRQVGDSVAPFGPGDLVLLGPGLPHAWVSLGRGAGARACVLQFPLALLAQEALPELRGARPLAEQARRGLQVGGASAAFASARLARMAAEGAFGRLAGLVEILGCLLEHPRDLRPIASGAAPVPGRATQERRIDRVTAWASRNLQRPLPVAEAARIARVTPGAFSRFFRREAGKPYSTWLNDLRCGEACVRLRQSREPIAAIAAACGFSSLSHFNRQFRRRMRQAPRDYRLAR